jgi:RNA-directed DNA polymerase
VLSAAFDGDMSEHSWGFRPGRSAHDAVTAARGYVADGKEWVADIDLTRFFDQVNHDRLMHLLGQRISDKRIMTLIGRYLRAPMDEGDGRHIRRNRGTPQGGPLSPLLANLYLDVLDRELEKRGLSFVRYADDSVPRRRTPGRQPCVQPCCTSDEGRPLEAAVQAEASNHPRLLPLREVVVSAVGNGRA